MTNSFVKIDNSKNKTVDELTRTLTHLKIKLDDTIGALLHLPSVPNYKYLIAYMYGDSGISVNIDSDHIYNESMDLVERLIAAGVPELQGHPLAYAEFKTATIDSLIEEKMVNSQLIINGSDIRYRIKNGNKPEPWLHLNNKLKVHITRLELTEDDIADYQKSKMADAFDKLKKLGIVIDDNGVFIIK